MIFRPSGLMGYQEITFNTFSTKYKQLIKWIKDNRNSRR